MYSSKDISVVIPAFNAQHTIIRALRSVFHQIATPGEVIVVDDGSSDRTVNIIRESRYADKVTVLRQENAGPAAARNTGIRHSRGRWLAFLDADDIWVDQNKLVDQIALANRYPQATLIDTFARVVWQGEGENINTRLKEGNAFEQLLKSNVINATSSVMALSEAVKSAGGFDETLKFGEDRLLWALLAKMGDVHTLDKVTVTKFNEPGNLTSLGEKNYRHRVALVNKLLALTSLSKSDVGDIWMANLHEFLRMAFKANNKEQYLSVYRDAARLSGHKVWRTKFFPIAVYAKLFGDFSPLLGKGRLTSPRRAA